MLIHFKEEARKVLKEAKEEMSLLKHPYIGTEHLLLSILKNNNSVATKLNEYHLNYNNFKEEVINILGVGDKKSPNFLYTPLLKRIMGNAALIAKENNKDVDIETLFLSMIEEGEGVAFRILLEMNVDVDEVYDYFNNVKKTINIGKDLTLENNDPVVGREKELERLEEILLRKNKNNPLLIGDAGVGKTALVEELSRKIKKGEVPKQLRNKKIISVDMASIVAGTKYRGEFEEKLKKIIDEVENNEDLILFIDEIHTLVGAGGAEGAIDASNIFKPALARGKLRCIGATTLEEYTKYIEPDQALERRFQKIIIEEPKEYVVKKILMSLKPIYERYHNVVLTEEIIDLILKLSKTYIHNRYEPDKSIDILDEVCASVSIKENKYLKKYNKLNNELKVLKEKKEYEFISKNYDRAIFMKEEEQALEQELNKLEVKILKNSNIVKKEDVARVIHAKTNIPVYEILKDNKKIIKTLEQTLSKTIIGQDKALEEVINIAKKIKLGFNDSVYSLLFTGPTGVGKTLLATKFGESMNLNIIRLDMSEYKEAHSISKIIGAPPGYVGYSEKTILDNIKNHPFSLLILDEIEKASLEVINLFLQVLDNGKLKTSDNKEINFDHVVIIMTSNIGYDNNQVGFNKNNSFIMNELNETLGLPLMNRLNDVIIFNNLNAEAITEIINNKLKDIKKKYHIKIDKKIVDEIKELSNYNIYGARKIDKIIKNKLENIIINNLINGHKTVKLVTLKEKTIV